MNMTAFILLMQFGQSIHQLGAPVRALGSLIINIIFQILIEAVNKPSILKDLGGFHRTIWVTTKRIALLQIFVIQCFQIK